MSDSYMVHPALQESIIVYMKDKLQSYIRPLGEGSRLRALMESAHPCPHHFIGFPTAQPKSLPGFQECRSLLSCHHIDLSLRNSMVGLLS